MRITYRQTVVATAAAFCVALVPAQAAAAANSSRAAYQRPIDKRDLVDGSMTNLNVLTQKVTLPVKAQFSLGAASSLEESQYDADVRSSVSALWADDWDNDDDSVYDSW